MEKYILTVFYSNESTERIVQAIMMKNLNCDMKGASCNGMLSINRFSATDEESEKVFKELKEEKVNFVMVKDSNAKYNFNKKLGILFKDEEDLEMMGNPLKKKSLKDQLAEAVANQDFMQAAALRDKIGKTESKKTEA